MGGRAGGDAQAAARLAPARPAGSLQLAPGPVESPTLNSSRDELPLPPLGVLAFAGYLRFIREATPVVSGPLSEISQSKAPAPESGQSTSTASVVSMGREAGLSGLIASPNALIKIDGRVTESAAAGEGKQPQLESLLI